DALYAAKPSAGGKSADLARSLTRALGYSAKRGFALPVRYAVLTDRLGDPRTAFAPATAKGRGAKRNVATAGAIAERLRVPLDCRDAARLAARWGRAVPSAQGLAAAAILDLFAA